MNRRTVADHLQLAVALGLAAAAAGCSTVSSRIRAHPAMFAQLPPDQQALVRSGRVAVGSGPAAVSLAFGDAYYVTFDSDPLPQTQVVHSYGDFMIPAATLPHPREVWHYQSPSLRGIVEGDQVTVAFDRDAKVAMVEQDEPINFPIPAAGPAAAPPAADPQALVRARRAALGFDPALVRAALGPPDRVTLRTDAGGSVVVWHYESPVLAREPDRTTIQDRRAVTFDASGRVSAVEEEEPVDFRAAGGRPASPGPLAAAAAGQVAIGYDLDSARQAFGPPGRVTLLWHYEAGRRVESIAGWQAGNYPFTRVRFGVTLAFDERGRVSAIDEKIGARAD